MEMFGHQVHKPITRCLCIFRVLLYFPVVSIRIPAEGVQIVCGRCENGEPDSGFEVECFVETEFWIFGMSHVRKIVVLARLFDCITHGLCVFSNITA